MSERIEDLLEPELLALEAQLASLAPNAMPSDLIEKINLDVEQFMEEPALSLEDSDLMDLEAQLALLVPSAIPRDLIDRVNAEVDLPMIDAAMNVDDSELVDLEERLGTLSPSSLSPDVLTRIAEAMDKWHEHVPVEEKVVPFNQLEEAAPKQQIERPSKLANFRMYSAAAAVALLGALAAVVLPTWENEATPTVATTDSVESFNNTSLPVQSASRVNISTEASNAWLVPDSLSHKVTHTSDAGVIMSHDNIPHRSIRIDYVDGIKVLDEDGREIEINRPGVQYMLIPVETN